MAELRVTTRERLVQQTSSLQAMVYVLKHVIKNNAPELMSIKVCPRLTEKTVSEHLDRMEELLIKMCDDTNSTYWDTIDYPGGENGFPYKGTNVG